MENGGDFKAFTKEQLPNLTALKDGFQIYYDVVHVLIDHHDDEVGDPPPLLIPCAGQGTASKHIMV